MATPIAGLPELAEHQAGKYLTHNQALRQLETFAFGVVKSNTLISPPPSPNEGDIYIVPSTGATGSWAGLGNKIVSWTNGAWQVYEPFIGVRLLHWDLKRYFIWSGSSFLIDNLVPYANVSVISTTYTVQSSDHSYWLICTGNLSIILPNSLPAGFFVNIFNEGLGTIALSTPGVLNAKGINLATQGSYCQALHKASNNWIAIGDLTP